MRFTTWNLWAGDTTAKLARLIPGPDVAVLCEVAQSLPSLAAGRSVPTWERTGTLPDRGVAIASWTIRMERATPPIGAQPGRHGLAVVGYVSAYHAFNGIDIGDEQPTYFHQFKRDRPFHIDMIFLPEHLVPNICAVDIAIYDGWIDAGPGRSDHVPVTIELELPAQ